MLHGDDHPSTLVSLHNYARFADKSGDPHEARRLYETLVEGIERGLPPGHWHRWLFLGSYGEFLRVHNDLAEAEPERARAMKALLHDWYRETGARFLRAHKGREPYRPF